MMNRLMMLAACAVLATTGIASATTRYYNTPAYGVAQPDKTTKVLGGIVNQNGGIVYGSGFSVSHPSTGEYVITINNGVFKTCPVVNITPAGTNTSPPLANLYSYGCGSGGVSLTVLMIGSTNGDLENNSFQFTAMQP
ncbi:MAG TPA: hypothetical protein VKR56_05710 [Candidatus Cybelea sp.]|nr:hypothetical protein [Candidatus Cybelea sp.]